MVNLRGGKTGLAALRAVALMALGLPLPPSAAGAQDPGHGVRVSAVAGLNFATWTGDDVGPAADRRTGFHDAA
jgi:hypothetical protein